VKVTWDPEDGTDKQDWDFDPQDVLRKEAEAIESEYGEGYDQWLAALQVGQIKARGVLLWHMMRQVHPSLKYRDVPDFRIRQLTVQMGVAELKKLWERLAKMRLDDDKREALEAAFEVDFREALAREGVEADVTIVDGKLAIEGATVAEAPKED